jgi:hypothetical protein
MRSKLVRAAHTGSGRGGCSGTRRQAGRGDNTFSWGGVAQIGVDEGTMYRISIEIYQIGQGIQCPPTWLGFPKESHSAIDF